MNTKTILDFNALDAKKLAKDEFGDVDYTLSKTLAAILSDIEDSAYEGDCSTILEYTQDRLDIVSEVEEYLINLGYTIEYINDNQLLVSW